ncbi:C45 family autoproteolytic acyltransferase/hydrolase [Radiobacillus kanasensis]|uniref:C45 family autoproteolytic acyltransferase/hydolase n=1 Tax=Radiobacillus kanasensis TaxID=2844358 RepID=UPI001E6178DF|nr:C45 family peptidase [Radiobacillus kanasensis]UFU00701.1 C45 family autoproteolytic acyltransferase/hydrolase [Radiobacillus kanasensis]
MKNIHSTIIQFRGNHYDFGYQQGMELKNSLILKNRKRQWKVRKARFVIDEKEAKAMFDRFAPAIWDELCGLGDALEWPMQKVLKEFGGYRLDYVKSGCSIVTGNDYFIRNYDYHPKTYEGRFVFYQPTDNGYAVVGNSQRITGRSDGMNENGLVMGYNFMHRKKPGDGFICGMIGRMVLENCSNVKEAVQLLQEVPHRHSFSYIVYDTSGQTYVVEASPRGIEVREAQTCTNHFEIMEKENRNYLNDSKRRLDIIENANLSEGEQAFHLLNGIGKGIFSTDYKSWAGTIHTSAYFPSNKKAWMALGGDQQPTELDFEAWLKGHDEKREKIYGEVDTDIPFVHMDENATWFK